MMRKIRTMTWVAAAVAGLTAVPAAVEAQRLATDDPVLQGIWDEGMNNSQFEALSQVLLDEIGPRLTASPGIEAAQRWAVETMRRWGVDAKREQYGTREGWDRGVSHVDLILSTKHN